jgi:hypothetical protein
MTTIQDAARDELADITERVAEIESQIDVEGCQDPSVDVPSEDMALFEERDRLLFQKQRLEKVVEEGLP